MEYKPSRICDIINDVNRDYFLPAIQREFVWEPEKIEKLFDSILGDYPIGTFLFWKIREENKHDWTAYEFIRNYDEENPHNNLADLSGVNKDIFFVFDRSTTYNIFLYRFERHIQIFSLQMENNSIIFKPIKKANCE